MQWNKKDVVSSNLPLILNFVKRMRKGGESDTEWRIHSSSGIYNMITLSQYIRLLMALIITITSLEWNHGYQKYSFNIPLLFRAVPSNRASGLERILRRSSGSVSCPSSSPPIQIKLLTYQLSQEVFREDGSPYHLEKGSRSNFKGCY